MANIIHPIAEGLSRSAIENPTTGAGGAQVGELVFNADAALLEFIYRKKTSSGYVHMPTKEGLILAAAAATSGSKLIGYFPASGLTSVTVQDALDELRAQIAAGGGGTVLGTMTAGKVPKALSSTTVGDSILSEASSKILFSGDSVANLYRSAAATLKTDGALIVNTDITVNNVLTAAYLTMLGQANFQEVIVADTYMTLANALTWGSSSADAAVASIVPSITKNNSNSRTFVGMRIKPTLNAGGSNSNTTFIGLEIDTVNTDTTGITVNLIKAMYGGAVKFKADADGDVTIGREIYAASGGVFSGSARSISNPVNGEYSNLFQAAFAKNNGTSLSHYLFGLNATLNAGGSNSSEVLDLFHIDTTNTSVIGMTVNLIQALYGGSPRLLLESNGALNLMSQSSFAQFNAYGVGVAGGTNTELVRMGHNGTNAYLQVDKAGSGTYRGLDLSTGAASRMHIHGNGNVGFWNSTLDHGGGEGVLRLHNATTVPSANPSAAVLVWAEGGALKARGASGTVTTIAPA